MILVTGGAGFIGTNLVKRLVEMGKEVVVVDDYSSGSRNNHIKGATYIENNTKYINRFSFMSYGKLEAVFHLGEFSKVAPSFEKVGDVIGKNMEGTTKVIEFCRKHKIKLIYAGSSTKYSKDGENSSPYAFSKAKNAQMIKNYGKWFGLKYSICYFYNNYGPYQDTCGDGWETVISIFEKQKKAGKKLTIVKPGTQKRNYTHVEDTIDGLIAAWLHEKNGEYQLGSMESYDMFELAKLFNCEYELIPERPGDRMESAYDYMLEDTYRELRWKPKHKLENWIK